MTSQGDLRETYAAAIQHGLEDVSDADAVIGVVRRPARWFNAVVDENVPALAPPADLLDAFQTSKEDLKLRGLCDEGAHNAAWDEVNFESRYADHLDSSQAQAAIGNLLERLARGDDVVLVCYENAAKKRCHRTALLARIRDAR